MLETDFPKCNTPRLHGFAIPRSGDERRRHAPPTVRGLLVINTADAVKPDGLLYSRDIWSRCHSVPSGVHVELHIGKARSVVGDAREIAYALADAGTVVVVGEVGSAISQLYRSLSTAFSAGRP